MKEMPLITPEVRAWIEWYKSGLDSSVKYYLELLESLSKPSEEYRPDLIGEQRDQAILQVDAFYQSNVDMALDLTLMLHPEYQNFLEWNSVDIPF